jgi:hypothetical protein
MAAGTAVCGAVEMILRLLVRLKNMKSFAPVAGVAHLITSNHLRGETCQLPPC